MAWLGFTELDRAVVLGSDWLVVCDCGFSVCALSVPMGFSYLGCGVSLHGYSSKGHTKKYHIFFMNIYVSAYIYIYKGRILDEHMLALKNQNDFT